MKIEIYDLIVRLEEFLPGQAHEKTLRSEIEELSYEEFELIKNWIIGEDNVLCPGAGLLFTNYGQFVQPRPNRTPFPFNWDCDLDCFKYNPWHSGTKPPKPITINLFPKFNNPYERKK